MKTARDARKHPGLSWEPSRILALRTGSVGEGGSILEQLTLGYPNDGTGSESTLKHQYKIDSMKHKSPPKRIDSDSGS